MSDKDPKAVDPRTGISIRFIQNWTPEPEAIRRAVNDRAFFTGLIEAAQGRRWRAAMTPAGLKVLAGLQISPD